MESETMVKYQEFPDLNLIVKQLRELYGAESGMPRLLFKMKENISDDELRVILDEHLLESKRPVERLVAIFDNTSE